MNRKFVKSLNIIIYQRFINKFCSEQPDSKAAVAAVIPLISAKSLPGIDIPYKNGGSQIQIGQLHCHYSLSNLNPLLQDRMNLDYLPCYF